MSEQRNARIRAAYDPPITDTDRINFLNDQGFVRWVSYGGHVIHKLWPKFDSTDIRAEIDRAIRSEQQKSYPVRVGGSSIPQRS